MLLAEGTRLGPYEILAPLGAGGMGEVYKARDSRLGRLVAVKVSTGRFSERFGREARVIAALNHPNILALYDVGEDYIVTELVEGGSLRAARLAQRSAIEIAAQIAEGLAAAHAAGIVHRDLKPENVMVTRDGRVKILDFGLSRHRAAASGETTQTLPGTVMGTVGYMSPEQVRGEEADHRSDIFSLGLILYEVLAGRRAFEAPTAAEVMAAILKEEPPELPPSLPASFREIVRHCLEKQPEARFQSAKDLSFALRSLLNPPGAGAATAPLPFSKLRRWTLRAALAAALGAAFSVGWLAHPGSTTGSVANYVFTPLSSEAGPEGEPSWAPDGKAVAYSAAAGDRMQIFIRRLDSPTPDQVTQEDAGAHARFWSRQGDRIYYLKRGQLWSISALGGASRHEADDATAAAIAPDGTSMAVSGTQGGLRFGRPGGGDWRPYGKPPFGPGSRCRKLAFSPDGRKLALLVQVLNAGQGDLWLIPYPPGAGEPRKLFVKEGSWSSFHGMSWMPDSRRMVVSLVDPEGQSQLYMGDSQTGELRKLTAGMEDNVLPAVSPDGRRIAYLRQVSDQDVVEVTLDGSAIRPVLATSRSERWATWLPNGREFVYASNANGPSELWVRNVEDRRARPLLISRRETLPEGGFGDVAVSPDGGRLTVQLGGAEHTIWALRPNGGKAVRIDPENSDHHGASWSPDGNWIAYGRVLPRQELMKVPAGGGRPVALASVDGRGGPAHVAWSPANDWIAWATSALVLCSTDGKVQKKLSDGAREGVGFSADGATLYAYSRKPGGNRRVVEAIDVGTGRSRVTGEFELDATATIKGLRMHPDGRRFLATLSKSDPDIVILEGF